MKSQFSLTRQSYNLDDILINETDAPVGDLIGLFFPPLGTLDHASVEVIECEWIEDSYISTTSGTVTSSADYQYSMTDVSDYDYVLIPNTHLNTGNVYSGLTAGANSEITPRITANAKSGYTGSIFSYSCMEVNSTEHYAVVSQKKGVYMPVLGIKIAT